MGMLRSRWKCSTAEIRMWVFLGPGFPGGTSGKEPACQCRRCTRFGFDSWVRKIPWRRALQAPPVFLPGKFHGQKSLAGHSLGVGHKKSDMSDHTHVHVADVGGVLKTRAPTLTVAQSLCS